MKKYVLICLSAMLLCACSSTAENKTKEEDYLYILYATPLADHPIWLQSKEGFDQACSEIGAKCDWLGPKVIDTETMNKVITQGIYQKADGIITQGVIDPALLEQAAAADIPVILVDSNMEGNDKFAFYGKNFHAQAQLLLDEVEKSVEENEKLYIAIQVAELNFTIAQEQIQEIRNVFAEHKGGFEIVEISESKSDKIRAQSEWMDILRAHEEINVSISFAAESADACGEIANTLSIKDRLHIYGVDDMKTTLDYIKKGYIDASIVTSFYEYGYKPVYQIRDYKEDKKSPQQMENEVKLIVVNADNVDTYKDELK